MTQLPRKNIQETLQYLEKEDLLEACLACRSYYQEALPLLFEVVAIPSGIHDDHAALLRKNGALVRGLIVDGPSLLQELFYADVPLATVFPRLRAIVITDGLYFKSSGDEVKWFSELRDLPELAFFGTMDRYSVKSMFPRTPRVQPICSCGHVCFEMEATALNFAELPEVDARCFLDWQGNTMASLKKVIVPLGTLDVFPQNLVDLTLPFELLFTDHLFGGIPSRLLPWQKRVYCYGEDNYYRFSLSDAPRNVLLVQSAIEDGSMILDDELACISPVADDGLAVAMRMPFDVAHCQVIVCSDSALDAEFPLLSKMPSLAISFQIPIEGMRLVPLNAGATRLSVVANSYGFIELLSWVVNSFPQLEHLELAHVFHEPLPFANNAFPNLVAFHCELTQPDDFWPQLILVAPGLKVIYASNFPRKFKIAGSLKPLLTIKPYQPVHLEGGSYLLDQFYKYI